VCLHVTELVGKVLSSLCADQIHSGVAVVVVVISSSSSISGSCYSCSCCSSTLCLKKTSLTFLTVT